MSERTRDADLVELLPWYVNGTLEEEERQAVDALLERSSAAREECAAWERVAACARLAPEMEAPSELGWHRLRREVRRSAADATGPDNRGLGGWKRIASAAAVVIICVQAVLLWDLPNEPAEVHLLGDAVTDVDSGRVLAQVRFVDGATWAEVSELLATLDAEIVSGPGTLGVAVIRLRSVGAGDSTLAERLAGLEASPVIEHARLVPGE